MRLPTALLVTFVSYGRSFSNVPPFSTSSTQSSPSARYSSSCLMTSKSTQVPSWKDLQSTIADDPVGKALNDDVELRAQGRGSPHVQNKLRLHGSRQAMPAIKLYRDHAGWCPYCQKTMLLVEEKQVPIQIELVPMRSYGDKPQEFMRKVPGGLLPAIEVDGKVITESSVIMDLLDQWHPPSDGFKPMLPQDDAGMKRFQQLSSLERELFSWWCTLLFRPEMIGSGGVGKSWNKLLGIGGDAMSGSMKGFMDCLMQVDGELQRTRGPWFFDNDYPTMIDFVFVSHVERMLASCAYWKGLNLRDPKWDLRGLHAWLDAFEKREHYLAFKSDYYTHIKDIPPQYGPGYDGGFEEDREAFAKAILGKDGSWRLPLLHDDALQPLYRGPPLPLHVLKAAEIVPDSDGSYASCDPATMAKACRVMASWKLSENGVSVAKFAARGGPAGSKNPRKTFGAELADPYAQSDDDVLGAVDEALRVICSALKATEQVVPDEAFVTMLKESVPKPHVPGVVSSLEYLRDRIGCPRDLPLASGRYLRAYINWGIDTLS